MGDMNDFIHKISEKAGFEPTTVVWQPRYTVKPKNCISAPTKRTTFGLLVVLPGTDVVGLRVPGPHDGSRVERKPPGVDRGSLKTPATGRRDEDEGGDRLRDAGQKIFIFSYAKSNIEQIIFTSKIVNSLKQFIGRVGKTRYLIP